MRVPDVDTDPRTEVGQVGSALNRMLGHVGDALAARHASETRVRQFVADASHELRTPLAAIRGLRRADPAQPGHDVAADVAHALRPGRVGQHPDDHARRRPAAAGPAGLGPAARPEPVDLSGSRSTRVSDAHAAGPDHRWLLDLPDEAVTVPGRRGPRCTRWSPTCWPTRGRTPRPAPPSPAALSTDDGRAVFTVTDDGPGIPAAAAAGGLRAVRPGGHAPGPARPAAPASAWPSWRRWSRRTAGGSPSTAGRAIPLSSCGCPADHKILLEMARSMLFSAVSMSPILASPAPARSLKPFQAYSATTAGAPHDRYSPPAMVVAANTTVTLSTREPGSVGEVAPRGRGQRSPQRTAVSDEQHLAA